MRDRDIIFRGKRPNGEWTEGFLIVWREQYFIAPRVSQTGAVYTTVLGDYYEFGFFYRVDPETVGQFTGMTDKNGKKIFEGDIVAVPPRMSRETIIGAIQLSAYQMPNAYTKSETHLGFNIRWLSSDEVIRDMLRKDILYWHAEYEDGIEVIGNIHDNPELLEVEE